MGDHAAQRKARVFIGSSSEARDQVQVFCDVLRDDAEMMPWWIAPEFEPGFSTMEALLLAVDSYDYGIFILTPDDSIESKGEKSKAARDNVLLEYGLFLATLGRERTFALIQESASVEKQVKLPSDLLGITIPRFSFRDQRDLLASVNTAVSKIRQRIKTRGRKPIKVDVIDSYAVHREFSRMTVTLSERKVTRNIVKLRNHLFAIVLAKGAYGHTYDSKDTVAGEPVFISDYLSSDLMLAATNAEFFGRTQPGDVVRVYLVMVEEHDGQLLRGGTSIKDMTTTGVYALQSVDVAIVG
jgi:Predicted nucleotide-binding protein containing TIR-like domain